jgi:Fe-S cluster assembly protein SufD
MGAPVQNPTQAEQDFFRAYALLRESTAAVAGERQQAFDRFARAGLPSRRIESWHYSDLRARLRQAPPPAARPDEADRHYARVKLAEVAARGALKLVLIDGFFAPELSDDFSGIAGVSVRALASLPDDDLVLQKMRDLSAGAKDALLDLNAAFSSDGVVIEIAAGTRLDKPIEIVALCGADGGQSRFSRNFFALGDGARASLIETRAENVGGFGDSALLLSLGQGAELDYVCRSQDSAAVDVQNSIASLGAKSRLRATALIAGTPFLRRQLFVTCAGEGAELHLSGAVLLRGREHADNTVIVTHEAPACVSRETYKYVLAEQANGVFQGKIVVPPQAQKTDGKMLCRGLVLSDDAAMSAKPELEIFADDVACGHGASCAKLDANQIFYMESRGIPKAEAQAILIGAFAAEAFDILQDEVLRDLLNADLAALLETGAFA